MCQIPSVGPYGGRAITRRRHPGCCCTLDWVPCSGLLYPGLLAGSGSYCSNHILVGSCSVLLLLGRDKDRGSSTLAGILSFAVEEGCTVNTTGKSGACPGTTPRNVAIGLYLTPSGRGIEGAERRTKQIPPGVPGGSRGSCRPHTSRKFPRDRPNPEDFS